MNLNAALDVITGLVLMYLVLSLFCTAINEIIAWVTSQRAKTLRSALQQLIDDPRLKALFYDHGLVDGAKVASNKGSQPAKQASSLPDLATDVDADGKVQASAAAAPSDKLQPPADNAPPANLHPSYLSSKTVAAAITGSLLAYLRSDDDPLPIDATFQDMENAVERLQINSNIRDALSACLADAQGNIDKFRDNVAQWFDNAMDRLSGAYKRYVQIVTIFVGVFVVLLFNADSLNVAKRLWSDHALGEVISQTAGNVTLAKDPLDPKTIRDSQPQCESASADNDLSNDIATMCALNADLRPLPIGWAKLRWPQWSDITYWLTKGTPVQNIFGWLITALALTQGAPFWFDLLQKIMNFRATGTKPKKAADPS